SYENALYFTKDELNAPIKNAYPGLLKYFETQAEKIIEDLYDDNWHARVKKTILLKLGNEDVDIEAIANELDISVRMLQNNLQNEGVLYSKLLEDVRKKLAKYYLQNFSIDVGTIAIYLGYNDISSFSRSFKKWFGMSPQIYRKDIPYSMGHAALT
ncbi:MAG: AraC-like DNA-binding protein, partial [Sulfurimonas sp.]